MKLIDKDALVAEIERLRGAQPLDAYQPKEQNKIDWLTGKLFTINSLEFFLNTLEVKEVDLELITGWFDHIAQIADDRMTLTNQRMTDAHALDEIKCLAKNSSEFITKHYIVQKGEEV